MEIFVQTCDLNTYLPPRMPRALLSCRFCRSQCRPQRISATSDARSATLVQILPSATSTPTHICHLGCPERYSRADSAVGNADPNTYLSLRMPGTLLSCRLCRPQCRPQHRSATSDAQSVTRLQILPFANLNPDLSPRMPRPRCPRLLCTLQHRLPKMRFKNTHTSEAWTPGTSTQIPSCLRAMRFSSMIIRGTEFAAFVTFLRTERPFATGIAPNNTLKRLPKSSQWLQRVQTKHGSTIM